MSGPIWPPFEVRGRAAGAVDVGSDPDLALLEAWRAGDPRAAESLLRKYYSLIRRTAATKLPIVHVDGVVESIIRVLASGCEVFRGDAIVRAYILATVRYSILNFYQRGQELLRGGSWTVRCSVTELGGGASGGLAQAKNNRLLLEALRGVEFDDQFVLELHYWENMPRSALAQVFGIAEAAIQARLHRAKRHLQWKIGELTRGLPEFSETISSLDTWAEDLRSEILENFKNENRAGGDRSAANPRINMMMTTDILREDLKQRIVEKPRDVVVVLATGVTIGALRGSPLGALASWQGLLESGIRRARELGRMPPADAERLRDILRGDDTEQWIAAAEEVTLAFGGREGGEFRRWLRETVGRFAEDIRDSAVVDALRTLSDHGVLLATVNYDGILEAATGLPPVTWRQGSRVERLIRGDEPGILHLHGYWEEPSSLVFGARSYEDVVGDEHAREALRSMRMQKTFVLIGHGAGLADPNWGSFLRWTEQLFSASEYRHYRLVCEQDREDIQAEHPPAQRLFALSYGHEHRDLGPFLRSLAPAKLPASSEKTVIILVNIGGRDHHWLEGAKAKELIGVEDALIVKVDLVIDRFAVSARQWRKIARMLDEVVKRADAVTGEVEYVVAGVAPLPVFAYLGQAMSRMGSIRFVNRRKDSNVIDTIGPPWSRGTTADRFQISIPEVGRARKGRSVLSIQCSNEYSYTEPMVEPMIVAEGASLLCSYQIYDSERSQYDLPLTSGDLAVLLGRVTDAEKWFGARCPDAEGRVIALGGPSWVAFWVGARLNPNVGGRIDFPNFVRGSGYVRALSWPMHMAPWFSEMAKILFMTAEPDNFNRIRGSKAGQAIETAFEREFGEDGAFNLEISGATNARELMREVERARPDILHLHLHGSAEGELCFEDERGLAQRVAGDTFVEMLEATGVKPTLIVLSACYSEAIAEKLRGIAECVISMTTKVHYKTAVTFSGGFYGALARGNTLTKAIQQGKLATVLDPPSGYDTIITLFDDSVNPEEVVFFPDTGEGRS